VFELLKVAQTHWAKIGARQVSEMDWPRARDLSEVKGLSVEKGLSEVKKEPSSSAEQAEDKEIAWRAGAV
jgi:hypothetical protein